MTLISNVIIASLHAIPRVIEGYNATNIHMKTNTTELHVTAQWLQEAGAVIYLPNCSKQTSQNNNYVVHVNMQVYSFSFTVFFIW